METYFAGACTDNLSLQLKLRDASLWPALAHSAVKTEGSRRARFRLEVDNKCRNDVFFKRDFVTLQKVCFARMNGIMLIQDRKSKSHTAQAMKSFIVRDKTIERFHINLQIGLLVCGGGQRRQVFAQLPSPTHEQLMEAHRIEIIELRTMYEKRVRPLNFSFVTVSAKVLLFLTFYLETVLPLIMKKAEIVENSKEKNILFMDTSNWRMLQSHQIRRTVKMLVQKVDPALHGTTPMTLRVSYATWLLRKYRTRAIFVDKEEIKFLEFVGKGINTSAERLRNKHCEIEHRD